MKLTFISTSVEGRGITPKYICHRTASTESISIYQIILIKLALGMYEHRGYLSIDPNSILG